MVPSNFHQVLGSSSDSSTESSHDIPESPASQSLRPQSVSSEAPSNSTEEEAIASTSSAVVVSVLLSLSVQGRCLHTVTTPSPSPSFFLARSKEKEEAERGKRKKRNARPTQKPPNSHRIRLEDSSESDSSVVQD